MKAHQSTTAIISLVAKRFTLGLAAIAVSSLAIQTLTRSEAQARKISLKEILSPENRITKDSPAGTIGWILVGDDHPLQEGTGDLEVADNSSTYVKMYPERDNDFPRDLYEYILEDEKITPGVVGPVLPGDKARKKRFKGDPAAFAFYNTDRTHTTKGQDGAIVARFEAPRFEVQWSKKEKPMNVIIVRVLENDHALSSRRFINKMIGDRHCYLMSWRRGPRGGTIIKPIRFWQLPSYVWLTKNNPYRSLVSTLQKRGVLFKTGNDFSQFMAAEAIYKIVRIKWDENGPEVPIKWDDIDSDGSPEGQARYEAVVQKVTEFIKNDPRAKQIPGITMPEKTRAKVCKALFK